MNGNIVSRLLRGLSTGASSHRTDFVKKNEEKSVSSRQASRIGVRVLLTYSVSDYRCLLVDEHGNISFAV